jgi:hypothetical protein
VVFLEILQGVREGSRVGKVILITFSSDMHLHNHVLNNDVLNKNKRPPSYFGRHTFSQLTQLILQPSNKKKEKKIYNNLKHGGHKPNQ